MTQILTEPNATDSGTGEADICHYYCCVPELAYCGLDISDHEDLPEQAPEDQACVVCLDISYSPISDDKHVYTCPNFGSP